MFFPLSLRCFNVSDCFKHHFSPPALEAKLIERAGCDPSDLTHATHTPGPWLLVASTALQLAWALRNKFAVDPDVAALGPAPVAEALAKLRRIRARALEECQRILSSDDEEHVEGDLGPQQAVGGGVRGRTPAAGPDPSPVTPYPPSAAPPATPSASGLMALLQLHQQRMRADRSFRSELQLQVLQCRAEGFLETLHPGDVGSGVESGSTEEARLHESCATALREWQAAAPDRWLPLFWLGHVRSWQAAAAATATATTDEPLPPCPQSLLETALAHAAAACRAAARAAPSDLIHPFLQLQGLRLEAIALGPAAFSLAAAYAFSPGITAPAAAAANSRADLLADVLRAAHLVPSSHKEADTAAQLALRCHLLQGDAAAVMPAVSALAAALGIRTPTFAATASPAAAAAAADPVPPQPVVVDEPFRTPEPEPREIAPAWSAAVAGAVLQSPAYAAVSWVPEPADEILQRSRMVGLMAECSAVQVQLALHLLPTRRGLEGIPIDPVRTVAALNEYLHRAKEPWASALLPALRSLRVFLSASVLHACANRDFLKAGGDPLTLAPLVEPYLSHVASWTQETWRPHAVARLKAEGTALPLPPPVLRVPAGGAALIVGPQSIWRQPNAKDGHKRDAAMETFPALAVSLVIEGMERVEAAGYWVSVAEKHLKSPGAKVNKVRVVGGSTEAQRALSAGLQASGYKIAAAAMRTCVQSLRCSFDHGAGERPPLPAAVTLAAVQALVSVCEVLSAKGHLPGSLTAFECARTMILSLMGAGEPSAEMVKIQSADALIIAGAGMACMALAHDGSLALPGAAGDAGDAVAFLRAARAFADVQRELLPRLGRCEDATDIARGLGWVLAAGGGSPSATGPGKDDPSLRALRKFARPGVSVVDQVGRLLRAAFPSATFVPEVPLPLPLGPAAESEGPLAGEELEGGMGARARMDIDMSPIIDIDPESEAMEVDPDGAGRTRFSGDPRPEA